jgi:hypothetical protein
MFIILGITIPTKDLYDLMISKPESQLCKNWIKFQIREVDNDFEHEEILDMSFEDEKENFLCFIDDYFYEKEESEDSWSYTDNIKMYLDSDDKITVGIDILQHCNLENPSCTKEIVEYRKINSDKVLKRTEITYPQYQHSKELFDAEELSKRLLRNVEDTEFLFNKFVESEIFPNLKKEDIKYTII